MQAAQKTPTLFTLLFGGSDRKENTFKTFVSSNDSSYKIASGDVVFITQYCQEIVSGTSHVNILVYALPNLVSEMRKRPQGDRDTVKDSLKNVLFHAQITGLQRERLYNALCSICRGY